MIEVPVMEAVPVVVMLDTATVPLPVARKELAPVMVGRHPARSNVWRPSPIACVPVIMPADRIPIAPHPNVIGAWARR